MKKIILLTLAASLIGLCGCKNKNATSSFKEYKFDDVLSNTEKAELIQHVKERLNGVSAVTSESYSKYEISNQKTESNAKTNLSLYDSAHVHKETTTTTNMVVDGITVKKTDNSTYDRFNYADKKTIVTYNTTEDDETYSLTYYTDEQASSIDTNVISNAVTNALPSIDNLEGYKDGSGYALALSNIDEEYTAYEWGDSTKELHTISRSQTIIKISSSYLITSCYTYADVETNRDPGTGGWYKKDKQVYLATNNITVKYGGVGSGSSIRLNILNKFSNGYISSVSVSLNNSSVFSVATTKATPTHRHIKANVYVGDYIHYLINQPFTISVDVFSYTAIRGETSSDTKTPNFSIESSGIERNTEGEYIITSTSTRYLYVEFDVDLYSGGSASISDAKIYLL